MLCYTVNYTTGEKINNVYCTHLLRLINSTVQGPPPGRERHAPCRPGSKR